MEEPVTRRERRRRRIEKNMEINAENEIQKTIENAECQTKLRLTQSSPKLFRKNTYVLPKAKSELDLPFTECDNDEESNVASVEGCFDKDEISDSKVFTYNVMKKSDESRHDTYNIENDALKTNRPIPAPRSKKSCPTPEKVSSDTDRDITEIDLDDVHIKSDTESKFSCDGKESEKNASSPSERSPEIPKPKPKPRKLALHSIKNNQSTHENVQTQQNTSTLEKLQTDDSEEYQQKSRTDDGKAEKEVHSEAAKRNEIPLIENLQHQFQLKSNKDLEKTVKEQRKLRIIDLVEKKGNKKKSNVFPFMMKLEKPKIPKISSILKDLKQVEGKPEEEEDNTDFQIDSPQYPESTLNGQIYVQDKNGFYVVERDQVLKSGNGQEKEARSDREMEESTVKTAIFFQKHWSRIMMYIHGVLAGFALGHAVMVTAVMLHYNYEPNGFIGIYSSLSLKIHYIFYTLTTFCVVSCFDRLDIGHMNRKHWQTAWKVPSVWGICFIYLTSFSLTFANHKTEARFDSYSNIKGNHTNDMDSDTQNSNEIQISLLSWFHTIWARDVLLLIAWFFISLTEFTDFLSVHLNNMVKYAETKTEDG